MSAPAIPLRVLTDALNALDMAHEKCSDQLNGGDYLALVQAKAQLQYSLNSLLNQPIEVTA